MRFQQENRVGMIATDPIEKGIVTAGNATAGIWQGAKRHKGIVWAVALTSLAVGAHKLDDAISANIGFAGAATSGVVTEGKAIVGDHLPCLQDVCNSTNTPTTLVAGASPNQAPIVAPGAEPAPVNPGVEPRPSDGNFVWAPIRTNVLIVPSVTGTTPAEGTASTQNQLVDACAGADLNGQADKDIFANVIVPNNLDKVPSGEPASAVLHPGETWVC